MQAPVVYSFHGGIHPPENKTQSLQLPLGRPTLPSELVLPLGQHIGQPSRPLVEIGSKVLKGQPVAINNGFLSSFLHAPTSGTVTGIELRPIAHPSGLDDLCLIIEPDGHDTWIEHSGLKEWQSISKTDVLAYLSEMGIVGMGGAGFPTQVKLQGAHKHPLSHFIINAAECEPYITADDMLIRERSLELILGIEILQHLVDAEHVIIGIEDNKPTAIAELKKVIGERNSTIQVAVVPTKYPSGGEKQLIKLLTNKEVPSGRHPADIGVLCQNVGTCTAVYDAIYHGKPLISRYTTLTGDALEAPQNVEVLLGTPVSHLLEYAGKINNKLARLVMGGPMMGFTLDSHLVPVVKTTNCILAASNSELPQPAPEQSCIRCGMCEQACPASLLPQQLLWFSKSQEHEKAEHYNLFDCIECGACSYVCPSSIPLVQYYRHTKAEIRESKEAAVKSDIAKQRFEARKARQEAEAAEKEAKRLARQKATPAKSNEAKTAPKKPAPAVSDSNDSKKAKVDLAIAKSKLKKLEKTLLEAQEKEHTEDINTIQLQVNAVKKDITDLEAKVVSAPTPKETTKTVMSDDAKKAKIDVALIGTKLKKAQKQLQEDPDNSELKDKVSNFEQELKAAQSKLESLVQDKVSPPVEKKALSDEAKKAKVDVALISTKLKKVEKQLADDPNNTELKGKIDTFKNDLNAAKERLSQLSPPEPSTSQEKVEKPVSAADQEAQKKLKIDTAIAKAAAKKADKALKKAIDINADNIENLTKQVADANARVKELEAAVGKGQTSSSTDKESTDSSEIKPTQKVVTDEEKKRKIDLAIAKAAVNKAKKGIVALKEQGKSEEEIAALGLPEKLNAAEQKLADLESGDSQKTPSNEHLETPPKKVSSEPDKETLKQHKVAAALAKAQVNKLTRRLELEPDNAEQIKQELEQAKQKQQEADSKLEALTNTQENR